MRAAVVMAVLLAGCSAAPSQPRVPSAATPSEAPATAAPSAEPKLSDFDKALRYTRCMTELGIKVPDPVVGEVLPLYPNFDANAPRGYSERGGITFQKAFDQCKALLPATWPVKESPAQPAKEKPFLECMRKHGIQTYEADADGMVPYPVDTSYLERPEYVAAENDCRRFYNDPAMKGGS